MAVPSTTERNPQPHITLPVSGSVTVPMTVYDCIVAVSAALAQEGIAKTRSNAQQGYKFRGIDEVLNALAPLLSKYRLVILPRVLDRQVTERASKQGGVLFSVTVEAEFDFVSAADGSKHTVKTYGEAMDSADKATNKAMSAAYKYAAFQTFCIPTEGDNDADAVTHEPKGYTVAAPVPSATAGELSVEGPSRVAPSGDSSAPSSLPDGAVYIERIDMTTTKNPNVKKYLLTLSTGETVSTIKDRIAAQCEQWAQNRTPVMVEAKASKWGLELVDVHSVAFVQAAAETHAEPVLDSEIPF